MSVADRLNKLTTDITSAYASIQNKGGTIPANKNTNNLPTAIDSIEVIESATAEGESLSLTNTKAMPYSDYVVEGKSEQEGEPSPSIPSEIYSVADDVNLLNNTATSQTINGITYTVNEDKSVVANGTATAHSILNLYGNLTISAGTYTFSGCPSNGSWSTYSMGFGSKNDSGNGVTFTETSDFTGQPYIRIANGTTVNNLIFRPKIQKGTTATPYSPYNQGTVTIEQRRKNLFDKDNANIISNYALTEPSNNNGWVSENGDYITYIPCKKNTQYTISKSSSDRLRISTTIENPTTFPLTYQYTNFTDTSKGTITTNENANYLCVFYRRFSDTLTEEEIRNTIQIEERNNCNIL